MLMMIKHMTKVLFSQHIIALLSTICYLLYAICYLLSTICYLLSATAATTTYSFSKQPQEIPFYPFSGIHSLWGSSVKIGTVQRRLAWPLRKDDAQIEKSKHVLRSCKSAPGSGRLRERVAVWTRLCGLERRVEILFITKNKSGTGQQFLLLRREAKAWARGVSFHRHRNPLTPSRLRPLQTLTQQPKLIRTPGFLPPGYS